MKKILLALGLVGLQISTAYAGEVKLTWGNLDQFTDVQEGRDSRDRFRENLMREFTDIFNAQAKKLPDGYVMNVDITDLDLAGDIRPSMSSLQIRIMTAIYWPRMSFTYELRNEKAEVIANGKEELRDMDYLNRARFPSGVTHFEFEERMVQDWFRRQLAGGAFPGKDSSKLAVKN